MRTPTSRSRSPVETKYYSAYGGAIQYGLSDDSNLNAHIEINRCIFKGNKAQGHGGGVAIRTSKSVIIDNCESENNVANNENTNVKLLFNNYYSSRQKDLEEPSI